MGYNIVNLMKSQLSPELQADIWQRTTHAHILRTLRGGGRTVPASWSVPREGGVAAAKRRWSRARSVSHAA